MADSETDLVGGFDGDAELSTQGRWGPAAAALEDDELPRLRRSSFLAVTMQEARKNTRDSCR